MNLPRLALSALAFIPAIASAADLIPFGSSWDYMHPTDGVDPAIADTDFDTTWYLGAVDFGTTYDGPSPSFATAAASFDAGNGAAPIGYDEVTYFEDNGGFGTTLTKPADDLRYGAYFRHDFTVAAEVDDLALEVLADDGVVIYLDGSVLWQSENFTVADTYTAFCSGVGSETETTYIIDSLGSLSAGNHTIAISLHQNSAGSSDLGFDLRLSDEGIRTPPFGTVDLGGRALVFALSEDLQSWTNPANYQFVLNDTDGGTLESREAALGGTSGALFVLDFIASEGSGASNFEDEDTFYAEVEFDDGAMGTSTLSLVPAGLDADGSGALNGAEFGPGIADDLDVYLYRPMVVAVPDGSVGGTVRVTAINNSGSETFEIRDARFVPAPSPAPLLGGYDFGTPQTFNAFYVAPGWTSPTPGEFVMHDTDAQGGILSELIDLTGMPQARISLSLNASETSENSNFEGADGFSAWVEVVDSSGGKWKVDLIDGGLDTDGNKRITGSEFAPTADDAESVNVDLPLSARLPPNAVSAQVVIVGFADSPTETFTLTDISITAAPPVSGSFSITDIEPLPSGAYRITWGSDTGNIYDLQFTPNLATTPFATVDTKTASGPSTSSEHDPGTAPSGLYRVMRRP